MNDLHAATTYPQATINDEAVAYWRFEETTEVTGFDTISSNGATHPLAWT